MGERRVSRDARNHFLIILNTFKSQHAVFIIAIKVFRQF